MYIREEFRGVWPEEWLNYCNWIIEIWCDSSSGGSSRRNINNLGPVVSKDKTGGSNYLYRCYCHCNVFQMRMTS